MPAGPQTDNTSLPLKLALRRKLLAPFAESHELRVMDCCAGGRRIWTALRKEFPVKSYIAFDKKRLPGTLRVDSARWIRQVGLLGNVIDVDTYGEPWPQYFAALEAAWPGPQILVFLTLGMGLGTLGKISKAVLKAAGLKPHWHNRLPPASLQLRDIFLSYCLTRGCDNGTIITEAWEASPAGSETRYFGLRLRRRKHASAVRKKAAPTTAGPQRKGADRG